MQNLTIDGIGTLNGGEYGIVKVDGIAHINGDLVCETMDVDGLLKASGALKTGTLMCDGSASFKGSVTAGRIAVDGMLKVTEGNRITAESIECDGRMSVSGEISADSISADGFIDAAEITGDTIRIRSCQRGAFFFLRSRHSRIRMIEATRVELRGVVADSVNGCDVRIDRGCRIKAVDCCGTLWISPGASVGSITGTYTRVAEK